MSEHQYTFVHTHKTPLLNLGYRVSCSSLALLCKCFCARLLVLSFALCVCQVFMRRNSVYLAFVLTGAIIGERVSP